MEAPLVNVVLNYPARDRVGPQPIVVDLDILLSEGVDLKSAKQDFLYIMLRQQPVDDIFHTDPNAVQVIPGKF